MKKILLIACATGFLQAGLPVFAQDATALYNEGLELKNQKKSSEAWKKFRDAVALKPDYTEARYELGWCLNDIQDYQAAIDNLRQVRIVWPAVTKVHFELGYAFEKTTQTDSAIVSYMKCLDFKPDYSGAYKNLGNIYYNKDENEKALYYYRKYEQYVKTDITDYLFFYRNGYLMNALKKFDSALFYLNKSLKYKTDYTNTWLEMGFANTRLKNNDEAISNFRKAMDLDPKSHIPLNGIGEVYRDNLRDINEAMNWYKKTLALNAKERKACYGMGYCLNSQQKYSEAIPYLRTAIEQEPTYTAAFVELGYALYKTASYTEAEEKLLKAISLSPRNENGRYYLVLLYVTQKNKPKAQKVVDDLRNISSKYTDELQNKVDGM
ncbi:MAG: tetratricopeptide repeat protein [Chitinophagaceae bacterium]